MLLLEMLLLLELLLLLLSVGSEYRLLRFDEDEEDEDEDEDEGIDDDEDEDDKEEDDCSYLVRIESIIGASSKEMSKTQSMGNLFGLTVCSW